MIHSRSLWLVSRDHPLRRVTPPMVPMCVHPLTVITQEYEGREAGLQRRGHGCWGCRGDDRASRDGIQFGGEQLRQRAARFSLNDIPPIEADQFLSEVATSGFHLGCEGQEDPGFEPVAELFGQAGQLPRVPHRLVALKAFLVSIPGLFELGFLPSELGGIGQLAGLLARSASRSQAARSAGASATNRSSARRSAAASPRCAANQAASRSTWAGVDSAAGICLRAFAHLHDLIRRHGPPQVGFPGGDILGTAPQAGRQPPRRLVERTTADRQAGGRASQIRSSFGANRPACSTTDWRNPGADSSSSWSSRM